MFIVRLAEDQAPKMANYQSAANVKVEDRSLSKYRWVQASTCRCKSSAISAEEEDQLQFSHVLIAQERK